MTFLASHETRAQDRGAAYLAPVPDLVGHDSMLYWLTRVCRERREEADRLQVHVAASLNRNQSTIDRFEEGVAWPRNADRTVAAYAEDLSLSPIELWQEALRRWHEHLASETFSEAGEAAGSKQRRADDATNGADGHGQRRAG